MIRQFHTYAYAIACGNSSFIKLERRVASRYATRRGYKNNRDVRLAEFFLEADERRNFSFLFFRPFPFLFLSFAARWVTSGRFRGGARRRPSWIIRARVRRSGQTSVKSRLSLRTCVTHKGGDARACARKLVRKGRELPTYLHAYAARNEPLLLATECSLSADVAGLYRFVTSKKWE